MAYLPSLQCHNPRPVIFEINAVRDDVVFAAERSEVARIVGKLWSHVLHETESLRVMNVFGWSVTSLNGALSTVFPSDEAFNFHRNIS